MTGLGDEAPPVVLEVPQAIGVANRSVDEPIPLLFAGDDPGREGSQFAPEGELKERGIAVEPLAQACAQERVLRREPVPIGAGRGAQRRAATQQNVDAHPAAAQRATGACSRDFSAAMCVA